MATPTLAALALLVSGSFPVLRTASPAGTALGEEEFGNKPVTANGEWAAGVLPVANDSHRVYRRWVNGNEEFFFTGDTSAVNAALARFARIDADVREVVLLPGPGETRSFEDKDVAYGWRLYAPSGICLAMARAPRMTRFCVYPDYATLTVHVAGSIELARLSIPAGVFLLGPDDLTERYREARQTRDEFQKSSAIHALEQLEARTKSKEGDDARRLDALNRFIDKARGVDLDVEFDEDEHTFSAALVNRRSVPVTLALPGDGSEPGMRTPSIRWSMEDAKTGEDLRTGWIGCGTINPIRADEIVTLAPGERRPIPIVKRLRIPGRYRVVLHYDNDPSFGLPAGHEATGALALVRSSERIILASRPIEVTVR